MISLSAEGPSLRPPDDRFAPGKAQEIMSEYLEKVIDAANEGIYVTDRDRRFVLWNSAAEKIAGYTREEMIGRACHDNILRHADSQGNELCLCGCPLKASIDDGKPNGPVVVFLRHKSGKRIPVEVKTGPIRNDAGEIIGGVEIFMDVTERLEQERLLQERKEKLETVLDNIGDGILFLDTGGNIAVFNRSCAKMLGLEKNAVGSSIASLPEQSLLRDAFADGEKMYQLSPAAARRKEEGCPQAAERFRCWTARTEPSKAHPLPHSPCYACKVYRAARAFLEAPRELTWGERTVSMTSSFIESPETNELWETVVFHDVTAEKLDAALKVAGAAAHELRQPLQAIVILAGLVEDDLNNRPSLEKHLGSIMTSCDRMDNIIEKMSEITRYRTKDYIDGRKILDIEGSANKK